MGKQTEELEYFEETSSKAILYFGNKPLTRECRRKMFLLPHKTLSRKEKFCILVIESFSTLLHLLFIFLFFSYFFLWWGQGGRNSLLDANASLQTLFTEEKKIYFVFKTLANC